MRQKRAGSLCYLADVGVYVRQQQKIATCVSISSVAMMMIWMLMNTCGKIIDVSFRSKLYT